MLVLAVGVAGFVFGREAASEELAGQVSQLFNQEMADLVRNVVTETRDSFPLATALGIGSVLLAGSMAFVHLQTALNQIWGIKPNEGQPVLGFLKQRLMSILGLFAIGILLLVSIIASTVVSVASEWLGERFSTPVWLIQTGELVIFLIVATVLFALVFRIAPDVKIDWRDLWVGAGVTAFMFNAGLYLIGVYLSYGTSASAYGAAGSLFALLLWVYYSAMVFFVGAEFTKVYARRRERESYGR